MKSIWIAITALAGLLLIGVASVAGTVTYTNDTNAVATGLEVEFSAPATITWHSGQCAKQDPSGFAAKFTFSGGSVNPGDTFMISWGPDAVKVVDHTWVTAASGTLVPGSDSSADDLSGNTTTTAPEQVKPAQPWTLTDEYGNTHIMDDDDIVLHLGVPVSQVEKIVWKRNGITMRFIDPKDKVTVLTNDLMKTFDGNYREHSPASSHTDHAIAGYDYSALVYLADGNLKAFKTTIESTFRWRPKEIWVQMDGAWMYTIYRLSSNYSLASDELINFFSKLKKDGFTGISFDIDYYMNSPADNTVLELPEANNDIILWKITTPSESEIEAMLKASSEVGLDAHVRGVISISQTYQKEHGFASSSNIEPSNPQKFFDSYTALWLKLVPLLNKYHVKLLTPFTEMDRIEKYPDLIRRMYTTISAQFEGEMGFEEATANMLNGESPINDTRILTESEYRRLVKNFTFWDWKDSKERPMRVEYSCWTPTIETQKDQRVSVMEHNFVKFWKPAVDYNRSTYPEDSQMFGEIGARNADGQSLGNTDYYKMPPSQRIFDNQEFSDAWDVFFKGSGKLGIESLDMWVIPLGDKWPVDYPGNNFINIGLRQPESPAYRVIKAIIKPSDE